MDWLTGKLLVAGADLFDPNFRRTVVLVAHHDEDGAVGVVLNRRSEATVEEAVHPLSWLVGGDEPLYIGGPVQQDAAVVLAEFDDPSKAGLIAFGSIGFFLGDVDAEAAAAVRRARIFAGYAGWGPGQLEGELAEGAWLVEPARPEDVFTDEPEDLWSAVLRRKGRRFEVLARMPADPSMN